ncbi:MAG: hypothetical protein JWR38_4552 [Mucilaginibacter sp.]|nr:hypothetical protein [Mucilaginibacter sp.]
MKQLDVFKKIGGILKELNDQYDYLEADSSDLNELELELFVANAHFLKDHAEILRRLHERNAPAQQVQVIEKSEPVAEKSLPEHTPEKKQEHVHEQRYFEPVVQQKPTTESKLELSPAVEPPVQVPYNPVKIETIIPITEDQQPVPQIELTSSESPIDTYSFERQEPEPVKQELEIEDTTDWEEEDQFEQEELVEQLPPVTEDQHQPVTALPLTPAAPEQVTAPADVSDNKTDSEEKVLTFNQKISAQKAAEKEKGTTPQVNALPITDLKSAINLNDKLLYIKDLFNGYSLAYSEAIEIVNRFNSFEEAERFLKTNYVVKNNWESKPATTQKFYDLLKRRYTN